MKRRDFIKKGSAALATTVVGSTLAGCGGGDSTTPTEGNTNNHTGNPGPQPTGGQAPVAPAPTPAVTPNPVAPPAPVAAPATPAPATQPVNPVPLATVQKTFYITDGFINFAVADPNNGITSISGAKNIYSKGFSNSPNELNVPGQSIIVKEGDSVQFTVVNTLNTTHNFTITHYGANAAFMDLGTTGPIAPGQTGTLNFVASFPGTYFYHDNTLTGNHNLNRMIGLHGGFAIMPRNSNNQLFSGSRTFRQQLFWIFNDIDYRWNEAVRTGARLPTRFIPQFFTINGLTSRPPSPPGNPVTSPDSKNPLVDTMHDPRTMLVGAIGDRTLMRVINFGMAKHSMHIHANHLEWLRSDGVTQPGSNQNDRQAFLKDVIPLNRRFGMNDVIYPFDAPPDAVPKFTQNTILQAERENREIAYPMHLHDEQTQTSNGSSYLFGALTDLYYKSRSPVK